MLQCGCDVQPIIPQAGPPRNVASARPNGSCRVQISGVWIPGPDLVSRDLSLATRRLLCGLKPRRSNTPRCATIPGSARIVVQGFTLPEQPLRSRSGMGCGQHKGEGEEVSDGVVLDRRVCGLVHWSGLNCVYHVGRDPRKKVGAQSPGSGRVWGSRGVCGAGPVAGLQGPGSLTAALETIDCAKERVREQEGDRR